MPFLEKKVVSLCRFCKRITNMTIGDIQALIHGDETRTLELKKTTGELKDGMRSVCALLNTAGGWLFFGITPTTLKILGQEVTDNTRKEIAREIAKLGLTLK
jgi:ATP-dependent DNA helicase RecG